MELSILICSLESRLPKLKTLHDELANQLMRLPVMEVIGVEVLTQIDNREITTGEKRNKLLKRASGNYVCFIDDDDEIYPNYIRLILETIRQYRPDCIATRGHYSVNGGQKIEWRLSKSFTDHDGYENGKPILFRRTNHLSPVRRELALKAMFPHISNAEDKAYSEALNPHLKTEAEIIDYLYHYRYETFNKQY